jgi:hypothetical protein
LHFLIGEAPYTVHLRRVDDRLNGYVAAGHVDAEVDDADAAGVVVIERMGGADATREILHQFFLERFALSQLSWTQTTGATAEERKTSWRTFFQAFVIPDSSEDYLLLDETHAIGNQEGLILSNFLGLRLAQPINELLVDSQRARTETKVSEEERRRAEEEVVALERERSAADHELRAITQTQADRRGALIANPDARRLQELTYRQGVLSVDRLQLQRRRDDLHTRVLRSAQARGTCARRPISNCTSRGSRSPSVPTATPTSTRRRSNASVSTTTAACAARKPRPPRRRRSRSWPPPQPISTRGPT